MDTTVRWILTVAVTITLLALAGVALLTTPVAAEEESVTFVGQNGTIVLDGEEDDPITIPECDGEEPLSENAPEDVEWEETCFTIDATLNGTEWQATEEDVTIPTITDTDPDSLASEASVEFNAPGGFTGTFDPNEGELTLDGTLSITADISAPLRQSDVCDTWADLQATTGASGDREGAPLENETATVVDGEYEVPAFDEGSLACDGANDAYGLPSESGDSGFELRFEVVE